ncbi:hypothetical protein [Desertivirga xinjiangensis]|uniref:hypothetical protein n=1 Tax=Desertivirga xinjiangensis TaxID=539206 RepID=UPI002109CE52|nr:hypothetical protein [Pedobacter xinjiangensis]
MKLRLNLTGSKSYYLYNGTEEYFKKMRAAYKDVRAGSTSEYLYFGFFTLCSATLEYSINFLLADYCIEQFGVGRYKVYLEQYLNMNFKNKLLMLPHIISNGEFQMNEDAASFKKIEEMIRLRNQLLHNKAYLIGFELPINLEEKDGRLIVPEGKEVLNYDFEFEKTPIERLTKENCLHFGNAIGDFKKYIMTPALADGLVVNEMVKTHNAL